MSDNKRFAPEKIQAAVEAGEIAAASPEDFVQRFGGTTVIKKVLIANNGNAVSARPSVMGTVAQPRRVTELSAAARLQKQNGDLKSVLQTANSPSLPLAAVDIAGCQVHPIHPPVGVHHVRQHAGDPVRGDGHP